MTDTATKIDFGSDLWCVAVHESGHVVAAKSLNCGGAGIATTSRGLTVSAPSENPMHTLALDWAGLIGQGLLKATTKAFPIPGSELSENTLEQWTREALEMFSHCDHSHDLFRSRWRPLPDVFAGSRLALLILSRSSNYLRAEAKAQYIEAVERGAMDEAAIEKFRLEKEQQRASAALAAYKQREIETLAAAITMPPDGFPAQWFDFVRIIAGDDATQFLHYEARRRGFIGPALQYGAELLLQDWAMLQKTDWEILARSFREFKAHETAK